MDLEVLGNAMPLPLEHQAIGTMPGGIGECQAIGRGHLAEGHLEPSPCTILSLPQTLHLLTISLIFPDSFDAWSILYYECNIFSMFFIFSMQCSNYRVTSLGMQHKVAELLSNSDAQRRHSKESYCITIPGRELMMPFPPFWHPCAWRVSRCSA
jgi:hypothetical protein